MTRQELIQLIANLESASYSLGFNVADSNNGLDELIKAEAEAEEALISAIDAIKNPARDFSSGASQGRERKPDLRIV